MHTDDPTPSSPTDPHASTGAEAPADPRSGDQRPGWAHLPPPTDRSWPWPAPAAAPLPPAPPPRSRRRIATLVAGGLALALLLVATVSCARELDEWGDRVDAEEVDSQDDARLASCLTTPDGSTAATLTLTNDSSGRSTYVVEVSFTASGSGAETGDAIYDDLAPGETTTVVVRDPGSRPDATCTVGHVERFAA